MADQDTSAQFQFELIEKGLIINSKKNFSVAVVLAPKKSSQKPGTPRKATTKAVFDAIEQHSDIKFNKYHDKIEHMADDDEYEIVTPPESGSGRSFAAGSTFRVTKGENSSDAAGTSCFLGR